MNGQMCKTYLVDTTIKEATMVPLSDPPNASIAINVKLET